MRASIDEVLGRKRKKLEPLELLEKSWPFSLAIVFLIVVLDFTSLSLHIKPLLILVLLHQLVAQALIFTDKFLKPVKRSLLAANLLNTVFISLLIMFSGGFISPLTLLYMGWIAYLAVRNTKEDILVAAILSISLYFVSGLANNIFLSESHVLSAQALAISIISIVAFSTIAAFYTGIQKKNEGRLSVLNKLLHQKIFELEGVSGFMVDMDDSKDLASFLKVFADDLKKLSNSSAVFILAKDKKKSAYECKVVAGKSTLRNKAMKTASSKDTAFLEPNRSDKLKNVMPEEVKAYFPRLSKKIKIKNALLFPVSGGASVKVAALCINKNKPFTDDDLKLSDILSRQARIFIEKYFLSKEINSKKKEISHFDTWLKKSRKAFINILEDVNEANENTERALNQTMTMYKIAVELSKSLDEGKLLESILKSSAKLAQAKRGCLVTCKGSNLDLKKSHNYQGDLQLKAENTPINWIARNKKPQIINDFGKTSYRRFKIASGLNNFVGVPLVQNESCLGVLCLFDKENGFSKQDMQNLTTLAHQGTVTIINARIHKREKTTIMKLKELDKMKADFVASVSHELRSPLTTIKGYLELVMEEEAGPINKTQKEFLGIVDKSTDRLQNLIGDLLTVSKIESASLEMDKKMISLNDIFKGVAKVMAPEAREHDLQLKLDLYSRLPKSFADPNRMEEVAINLISNAIKFSPKGGAVEITSQVKDEMVVGSIKDHGIGISDKDRQQLFDKFFRSKDVITKSIKGTGLGLAIVKGIMEKHKGKVWAESELGKGSTFYITLPIKKKKAA